MIRYLNNNHINNNKIMPIADIDFEGTDIQGQSSGSVQNADDSTNTTSKEEDVTHFSGNDVDDITNNGNGNTTNTTKEGNTTNTTTDGDNNNDNPSTGELNVGDQLEVDGVVYTVDKDGNLINDKGEVFKEAKDVNEWLKSVNVEEDNNKGITLSSIQDELGVTITDEEGKPVEFTDDAAGVRSYIDSVISLKSNELQQAAINRLYADNPLLRQFQDYVQLNGTARGFGEIPDRSNIKLDKDNEQQLIAVIKMAAQEFGNKSLNDNYIKYLKDSGGLYNEANTLLEALVQKDKAYRKEIETQAAKQRKEEEDSIKEYWERVHKTVNSRMIGKYKLPENFVKEIDGKKVVITPNDLFKYVSEAAYETPNGSKITGYQKDLQELSDEEYLNREMLDAWLMLTGGTYKDLIDMAVKENEVRRLVIKSNQNRSTKSVKVIKKQTGKTSIDDIIL